MTNVSRTIEWMRVRRHREKERMHLMELDVAIKLRLNMEILLETWRQVLQSFECTDCSRKHSSVWICIEQSIGGHVHARTCFCCWRFLCDLSVLFLPSCAMCFLQCIHLMSASLNPFWIQFFLPIERWIKKSSRDLIKLKEKEVIFLLFCYAFNAQAEEAFSHVSKMT